MDKKVYLSLTEIDEVVPILNKISIFGGLSRDQIEHVFKVLKKIEYDKDEVIFHQGDSSSYIYTILSGKVKLHVEMEGAKLELIELDVGKCFGESSLIGVQPHTATAIALEKTKLVVLSGKSLAGLYETHPKIYGLIILNVARETSRRLHQVDDTLLHYVKSHLQT